MANRSKKPPLPPLPAMSEAERAIVLSVLEYFRCWAERGRLACEETGRSDPDSYDFRNAVYWRNVASGMKWAHGVAKRWDVDELGVPVFTL